MAAPTKDEHEQTFACTMCDFVVDYHYHGKKPPFSKHIVLHEDCFIMKDPFSTTGGFISVGTTCSICQGHICMSSDCSLFYTRRFCLNCALKNMHEFPMELQAEICNKRNK